MKKFMNEMEEITAILKEIKLLLVTQSKPILSVEELAQHLSLSTHTIYKLCSRKRIPYRKLGGRNIFIRDEIDTWLKTASTSILTEEETEERAKEYIANR